MTDPDLKELDDMLPKNANDLKPWHPLMGFGWDAVRRVEAHHYSRIADVKYPISQVARPEYLAEQDAENWRRTAMIEALAAKKSINEEKE